MEDEQKGKMTGDVGKYETKPRFFNVGADLLAIDCRP